MTKSKLSQHVSICFEEESINILFSELLRSRGVATCILPSPQQAHGNTKIITEPQYLPLIPESYKHECLVVGNKESLKAWDGIKLSRPLTEQKIETAIAELLEAPIA
jgi:hypothetical protein